jgi:prevent-host-death family protein
MQIVYMDRESSGDLVNHEAKTNFSKLVDRAAAGEEIIIGKAGKPVARLVPYKEPPPAKRKPGAWKGKLWISPDFDMLPTGARKAITEPSSSMGARSRPGTHHQNCESMKPSRTKTRVESRGPYWQAQSFSSLDPLTLNTARNASCGISTRPTRFMRRLPSFCFSSSLRLREISPP